MSAKDDHRIDDDPRDLLSKVHFPVEKHLLHATGAQLDARNEIGAPINGKHDGSALIGNTKFDPTTGQQTCDSEDKAANIGWVGSKMTDSWPREQLFKENTMLYAAAARGIVAKVKEYLANGADPNMRSSGDSPLTDRVVQVGSRLQRPCGDCEGAP